MKFVGILAAFLALKSHPAWGAWIEIVFAEYDAKMKPVAPRMGCVD